MIHWWDGEHCSHFFDWHSRRGFFFLLQLGGGRQWDTGGPHLSRNLHRKTRMTPNLKIKWEDKDRNLLTQTFNTTWSSLGPGSGVGTLTHRCMKTRSLWVWFQFYFPLKKHELWVDQGMSVCPVIDTHWTVHVLSVTWGTGEPNEELLNIRKWMHEGACGWPSPTFSSEQKWLLTRVGEDLRWFQLNLEPGQGCWGAKGGGLPVVWTYLAPNVAVSPHHLTAFGSDFCGIPESSCPAGSCWFHQLAAHHSFRPAVSQIWPL